MLKRKHCGGTASISFEGSRGASDVVTLSPSKVDDDASG
jgi:hypothetical protein